MASPRRRPRTSAACAIAIMRCPASSCARSRFFSGARRRCRTTRCVRRRESQGERAALSPRGHRRRGELALVGKVDKAPALGFDKFIITATTPLHGNDLTELVPEHTRGAQAGFTRNTGMSTRHMRWRMLPHAIDRVYVNTRARDVSAGNRVTTGQGIAEPRFGQGLP